MGEQYTDDLTLSSSATARGVTWWDILGFNDSPVTPIPFELIFYADSGGLPALNNVISTTAVSITNLTDTGRDLNGDSVYRFQAALPPPAIPAGTRVWTTSGTFLATTATTN